LGTLGGGGQALGGWKRDRKLSRLITNKNGEKEGKWAGKGYAFQNNEAYNQEPVEKGRWKGKGVQKRTSKDQHQKLKQINFIGNLKPWKPGFSQKSPTLHAGEEKKRQKWTGKRLGNNVRESREQLSSCDR